MHFDLLPISIFLFTRTRQAKLLTDYNMIVIQTLNMKTTPVGSLSKFASSLPRIRLKNRPGKSSMIWSGDQGAFWWRAEYMPTEIPLLRLLVLRLVLSYPVCVVFCCF